MLPKSPSDESTSGSVMVILVRFPLSRLPRALLAGAFPVVCVSLKSCKSRSASHAKGLTLPSDSCLFKIRVAQWNVHVMGPRPVLRDCPPALSRGRTFTQQAVGLPRGRARRPVQRIQKKNRPSRPPRTADCKGAVPSRSVAHLGRQGFLVAGVLCRQGPWFMGRFGARNTKK